MDMRVLWIVNICFPDISVYMNFNTPVIGGWLYSLAENIKKVNDVKLAVATVYRGKSIVEVELNGIIYYLLPSAKGQYTYDKKLEKFWIEIRNKFQPDIIHIHGTELAYGLSYIKACSNKHVVISIQGLTSIYKKFYFADIRIKDLGFNIISFFILKWMFARFLKSGKIEMQYIKNALYIIGRTDWDKANVLEMNSNVTYHFCNEILRSDFYKCKKWDYNLCEKHSILFSQASSPIKGLHQLLKALALVVKQYPDVKLYISGENPLDKNSLKHTIKYYGYGYYINSLIKKFKLEDKIIFLGRLSSSQVKDYLLNSNLFVCPSSIENSPNSLGEAQLLGVPCIASYVGGIPNMVENQISGLLYRFEDYNLLAMHINNVFENSKGNIEKMSKSEILKASQRHNIIKNVKDTVEIYNEIIQM